MFRCKHCSKPAVSMERVQNPDRDVKYYPDHCGKCALEHISKEYIVERAATCGCNRERYSTYLSCYACVHYTNRMGRLYGLITRDGVRVGCGKEITSDNTKRITDKKLCDDCFNNYLILKGHKQMKQCECCGYLLPISVDKKCDGSRARCPNEHAGRDGNTECSDLCQNVIQVNDVWWQCSGTRYQSERYCAGSKVCKNDKPNARTASGYNTVHLLNKWSMGKDAQMLNDYNTEQETTPTGVRHNSTKAKLYGKTPWVGIK